MFLLWEVRVWTEMAHRLALAFGLYVAHVSISEYKRSISPQMVVPDYFGFFLIRALENCKLVQ